MSKFIAISYSVLVLIQSFSINLEDISKFKVLLEHAEFHQETYGDSFGDFLGEHYGNKNVEHGNNHKDHKDLPFKDSHHMSSHINTSFTINSVSYDIKYSTFIEIPFNFFYKESTSVFDKLSVFQPPKLA
tara:strand:- start:4422 stop:4811 length:390 start_codon:yes stop_codon:yes gene_type:complete